VKELLELKKRVVREGLLVTGLRNWPLPAHQGAGAKLMVMQVAQVTMCTGQRNNDNIAISYWCNKLAEAA
jgi:hypothetical protein